MAVSENIPGKTYLANNETAGGGEAVNETGPPMGKYASHLPDRTSVLSLGKQSVTAMSR